MNTIIILVLLIIFTCFVIGIILYIQNKLRDFSRSVFGTDTISEGAEQMRKEYASTPKSVAAMTSLLLPKIVADFPDFEYNEMKSRAENVLTSYLRAINDGKTSILQDGNTELKGQLENQIQTLHGRGKKEHFEQIKLHRTEITTYRKNAGRCIITFQTALECFHYITDEDSGKIEEGSKEYKYQTKYNTDLIYVQDRNLVENELDHALGVNCPNCGAPLKSLGAKVCEYCGTPVIELNIHAWSFSHIEKKE